MGRALVSLVGAMGLAFLSALPAAAADEGTVIFHVEVRGQASDGAWFLVGRDTDPPTIIEPGIFVCGPTENPYTKSGPVCATGETYETGIALRVGTELHYSFWLGYGWPEAGEEAPTPDVLLEGDITVHVGTQHVTLVHDFSGRSLLPDTALASNGAAGIGFTVAQALPNTAMSASGARGVVASGPAEYEEVIFRITLEGPVNAEHEFAVKAACREERCLTENGFIVCGPPSASHALGRCAAGTYETTLFIRAGLTLDYALLRSATPTAKEEVHLNDSWVVQEGRQVISLGFVYSGGSLPDTALPAPCAGTLRFGKSG